MSNILKEYRSRSGLTLRQVEESTGISNAYLSQLENGKIKNPSIQTIYALSKLYSVSIEQFAIELNLINRADIKPAKMTITLEEKVKTLQDRVRRIEFMLKQNA